MANITATAILIDKMTPALKDINNSFKKTGKAINDGTMKGANSLNNMKSSLLSMKGAFAGLAVAGVGIFAKSMLNASAEMENLETKFKVLLGDVDSAKARMQELSKFAQTTPFQLEEVANASRVLQTLGGSAFATGDSLRMVGDASAVAGESFENLAIHIGRAYSGLQSNRAIGESLSRLQELGLVSGQTRNEIEELQKASKGKEAWTLLQKELKKTEGGMSELSQTFGGLTSTLKDQFQTALRDISSGGFFDAIKNGLLGAVNIMNDWINSGVFLRIGGAWDYLAGGIDMFANLVVLGFQRINEAFFGMIYKMSSGINSLVQAMPKSLLPDSLFEDFQRSADGAKSFFEAMRDSADDTQIDMLKATEKMNSGWDIMVGNVKALMPKYEETLKGATQTTKTETDTQVRDLQKLSDAWNQMLEDNMAKEREINEQKASDQKMIADRNKATEDANLKAMEDSNAKQDAIFQKGRDNRVRMAKEESEARWQLAFSLTQSLSTIAQNALGKDKKTAKLRKAIALSEAIVNTGLGVTKALGSSAPPLNLINAGIVASVGAANISNIATQKFAQGGIVKGQGGVSDVGDKTMIRVNAGEGVFTKDQMKALGQQRSISVAPVINIQGNADSGTIQGLREQSQNIANRVIEAIRNNSLDLVNELNLVTA